MLTVLTLDMLNVLTLDTVLELDTLSMGVADPVLSCPESSESSPCLFKTDSSFDMRRSMRSRRALMLSSDCSPITPRAINIRIAPHCAAGCAAYSCTAYRVNNT